MTDNSALGEPPSSASDKAISRPSRPRAQRKIRAAANAAQEATPIADPGAYIRSILDRELNLTLRGVELGSARDDSMRELTRTAATLYDGRILRELIQNAYDGSGDDEEAEILLRLDLSVEPPRLDVANSGRGFTKDDVDSIVNPALSRKRPGNSIGHKGLGFRSVELVSDDPQIYSVAGRGSVGTPRFDGFCFRFASESDQRRRLERLAPESREVETAVGKTHQFQLPVALTEATTDICAYAQQGFASLVRLPLKGGSSVDQMAAEWQALFDERDPLILFLNRIGRLTLECVTSDGTVEQRVMQRKLRSLRSLSTPQLEMQEVELDGRRYLVARGQVERGRFLRAVEDAIVAQHRVDKWRDWQGAPIVSIAVPLSGEPQRGCYYAFLPMETEAPFHGFIDAPFFPDPDRKDLALSNPLNDVLLDVAAEICLAAYRRVAEINEARPDFVHAAVDAIAWHAARDRIFKAINAVGLELGKLPLPIVKRPDREERWGTLDSVFDWRDEDYQALKGSWIGKVTDEELLRRNLGARRTEGQVREHAGRCKVRVRAAIGNGAKISWSPRYAG